MKSRLHFLIALALSGITVQAQTFEEFSVSVEEITIANMPALQSFAFATHDGYWLLAGGRSDGLHEHMPPSAFPESGENIFIYVISPETGEVWSSGTAALPENIREQLGATNMQFQQVDSVLYLIGGYGFSAPASDHITFPYLLAMDVPELITAIQGGADISPYIRQLADERMAVTGGHLGRLGQTFYLAGGQRFDGRYNPHSGPSFTQQYTNAIREFDIVDDGSALEIVNYVETYDSLLLHRRDYNMHPQISPDGTDYYTMFSGVFRYDADLPWLDGTHFGADWMSNMPPMTQLLNQYHTASLPIYDNDPYAMHTLFFGGIGMYYYEDGSLFIDSLVPFTRNISRMTRVGDTFIEYNMEAEMPAFLGASAEFIGNELSAYTENGILRLHELPMGETAVGYIIGGIECEARNIFMLSGSSWASNRVFRVWVNRTGATANYQVPETTTCQVDPNPCQTMIQVAWPYTTAWTLQIYNVQGKQLLQQHNDQQNIQMDVSMLAPGQYVLRCNDGEHISVQKIIKQ
jgi:hypothetical protein